MQYLVSYSLNEQLAVVLSVFYCNLVQAGLAGSLVATLQDRPGRRIPMRVRGV